ncbi:MAG: DNA integrity scanning diadenylate cyclase DisA [Candidatus Bipolaricaulota bacterium]
MEFNSLQDLLGHIAPGTEIRDAIDRIVEQGNGGLIVIAELEQVSEVITSGFEMDADFTSQRLAELAKMDGALILSEEMTAITYSNTHLAPDPTISTDETGTRHKAAEQTAKQLGIPVIAISERRKRITIYFNDQRYILRDLATIISKVNQALLILDQYRNDFDEAIRELTALELDGRVLPFHVANVLRRIAQMLDLRDEIRRMFVELGEEKDLPARQLDNLLVGIEREFHLLIKDFQKDLEKSPEEIQPEILDLSADELLSTENIMGPLGYEDEELDSFLSSRGFRILNKIPRLPNPVIERMVEEFDNLDEVLKVDKERLKEVKGIAEARANTIKAGLRRLENRITIMEELQG